jgi:hypothetical protein
MWSGISEGKNNGEKKKKNEKKQFLSRSFTAKSSNRG